MTQQLTEWPFENLEYEKSISSGLNILSARSDQKPPSKKNQFGMITEYIRADMKNKAASMTLSNSNKERGKILDRAFRMPAGEVSAADRLRNYRAKRIKEEIHKN